MRWWSSHQIFEYKVGQAKVSYRSAKLHIYSLFGYPVPSRGSPADTRDTGHFSLSKAILSGRTTSEEARTGGSIFELAVLELESFVARTLEPHTTAVSDSINLGIVPKTISRLSSVARRLSREFRLRKTTWNQEGGKKKASKKSTWP